MADRYINASYVAKFLGTSVVNALVNDETEDPDDVLGAMIEAATASVQSDMRNSGYTVAADTVGDGVLQSDPLVRSATMGALWELLVGRPGTTIALPEEWKSHPLNVARVDIRNGNAQLPLSVTARDAVGGVSFTDSDPDSVDGRPPRMSREEIGTGY